MGFLTTVFLTGSGVLERATVFLEGAGLEVLTGVIFFLLIMGRFTFLRIEVHRDNVGKQVHILRTQRVPAPNANCVGNARHQRV